MGEFDTGNPVPWAGLFCGREAELGALMAAYDRVAAGSGPEIAVVLGESGLGKTRLVQEFFARLSSGVDAAGDGGYWPDRLVRDANNLKINPDPADCNRSHVADMRFLWWGIRMLDRSGHNAGMGGLSETVSLLRAHLEPFARARLTVSRIKGAAKSAALDVAIEIGNLFTFGLLGLGKLGLDHVSEWKSIADERRSLDGFDLGAETERQRDSLVDIVLADLGALFDTGEDKGERLPAIVLLDDAQWLSGDETTRTFVARLLHRARADGWPLLVVATHWEKEWYEHAAADDGLDFASLARGFAPEGWEPLKLGREPDLAGMIRAGFPGLAPEQVNLLLRKADGNPRLLDEILRHMLRKPRLFEGRDRTRLLSSQGERTIETQTFALHDLVDERLAASPPSVRYALGLASLQGDRFLEQLIALTAESVSEQVPADGIALAENPHCMIAGQGDGIFDFAQRVFLEVASEQLDDFVDAADARDALRDVVVALAGAEANYARLEPFSRPTARRIAIVILADPAIALDEHEADCLAWCYFWSSEEAFRRGEQVEALQIAERWWASIREDGLDLERVPDPVLGHFSFILGLTGKVAARRTLAEEMLRRARRLEPGVPANDGALQEALESMGRVLEDAGDPRSALPYLEQAHDVARSIADRDASQKNLRRLVMVASHRNGTYAAVHGESAAAPFFDQSLDLARRILAEERSAANLSLTITEIGNRGLTVFATEGPRAALALAQEQERLASELVAMQPGNEERWASAVFNHAQALQMLGLIHHKLDDDEMAVEVLVKAVEQRELALRKKRSINDMQSQVIGFTLLAISCSFVDDDYARAQEYSLRGLAIARTQHALIGSRGSAQSLAYAAHAHACALLGSKRYDDAIPILQEADRMDSQVFEATRSGNAANYILRDRIDLARAHFGRDADATEGLAILRSALDLSEKVGPDRRNAQFEERVARIQELIREHE